MADARKASRREPYAPPVLQPQKLFVDAVTQGCCRVSITNCSEPMRASGGTGGKTQRGRSGT